MHDLMFADQQKLKIEDLVVKGVPGRWRKVKGCLGQNKYLAKVEKDIQQ